jgi:hypothetical protein
MSDPDAYGLSPHKPKSWAKRKPAPWGGGGGRFCRPAWFDEPPPEELARARPALASGAIRNGGKPKPHTPS